jgi:hypothetical protein
MSDAVETPARKEVRETRIVSRRVREFPEDAFTFARATADGASDMWKEVLRRDP